MRYLAQNGQLEFVNAGWSMHDEACTHVDDMIDNMMIGHQFLMAEVGVKPRIGWHIDPFGHASATPRLMAQMGFDAFFFLADRLPTFGLHANHKNVGESVELLAESRVER